MRQFPPGQEKQRILPSARTAQLQSSGHLRHVKVPLHTPLKHSPELHWSSRLHFLPAGLGLGAASAIPEMEANAPPTRAAPINLSALPRERLPLASYVASTSKENALLLQGTSSTPFPKGRD
jgi:hypothetical protein